MPTTEGRRVTIRDIAKIARVSPSTVSQVLNGKGNINPKTRQHVKKIADQMNYQASPMARWLRGAKTYSIGVIIDHFHNQHFTNVFKGIEEVTDTAGFTFFVSESHENLEKERHQVKNMAERGADGIIIIPCSDDSSHLKSAQQRYKIPIVLIGNYFEENPYFFSVVADNWSGSRMVTDHLLALNRLPIIHVAGAKKQSKLILRRRGFEHAFKKGTGKAVGRDQIYYVDSLTPQDGYGAMLKILNKHRPPFSLYVVNDNTALGVITCCREKGLRIPEDVAVAGFSDINTAGQLEIPLTTIHIPATEMGRKAATILLECIDNPEYRRCPERVVLPVSLIIRKSTQVQEG